MSFKQLVYMYTYYRYILSKSYFHFRWSVASSKKSYNVTNRRRITYIHKEISLIYLKYWGNEKKKKIAEKSFFLIAEKSIFYCGKVNFLLRKSHYFLAEKSCEIAEMQCTGAFCVDLITSIQTQAES